MKFKDLNLMVIKYHCCHSLRKGMIACWRSFNNKTRITSDG